MTFKFVKDKAEEGEFFLEIKYTGTVNAATYRKVYIMDIDKIEPVKGT